ncbi:SIMPL domain-containing protein [Pseudomonas sp. gcc21]|uniref:SIMPL domain-containing protein n=1 Tax=Pseudomonas sp. gcc21 TaxID=2726989 RepID=UPI0014513107|nr:SIMPL domain-containing protein [Pseudomonas sp. gcc21]QJD58818.1 SIMPL domain-containing protein [Pseudomonas sp. gcc21]
MSKPVMTAITGILAALIVATALVLMAMSLKSGLLQFGGADRVVSVKGLAERNVEADLALWPVSFSVADDSLDRLQGKIEEQQGLVRSFLLLRGFVESDIQLSMPRITDQHANTYGNTLSPERYRAEVTVLVRTQDIESVQSGMQTVGELVKSGIALTQNYDSQPRFLFTRLELIKADMIADATRDARAAADQFARDADAEVGSIRRASQGYFSIDDVDPYTPQVKRVRVVTNIDYSLR